MKTVGYGALVGALMACLLSWVTDADRQFARPEYGVLLFVAALCVALANERGW